MSTHEEVSDTERLAIELFGWRWISFIGIPVRGTEGYPAKMRVRRLLSPEVIPAWMSSTKHEAADATGDEPLCYAYCSSGGGPLMPECLAHRDDYGILAQARNAWKGNSPEWPAFLGALPECSEYKNGDFRRAAIAALDAVIAERREKAKGEQRGE